MRNVAAVFKEQEALLLFMAEPAVVIVAAAWP